VPVSVSLDRMPHPSGHFSDGQVEPFAQVTAPGGLTYALIALDRLGGLDVFLMTSRTPADRASWSRPLLVPDRAPDGIAEPKLSWVGDGDRLRRKRRAGAPPAARRPGRSRSPPSGRTQIVTAGPISRRSACGSMRLRRTRTATARLTASMSARTTPPVRSKTAVMKRPSCARCSLRATASTVHTACTSLPADRGPCSCGVHAPRCCTQTPVIGGPAGVEYHRSCRGR
jgi:hypothetical protein